MQRSSLVQFLRRHIYVVSILALSVFAWGPLLSPAYFFQAHDAPHSVFFLVEFDQTLRDGYLWPRWAPDFAFGYGYPLFNLYSPLAFYAAEILHLLGLSLVGAIKAMYGLATVGAGLAMFGFVRRLMGREAGFLAAIVYMFVPFHLVEIFVRSAYAEFVALALLPLALWAFTDLILAPSWRGIGLAGLAYGALALTHHTSFFTFTPLLVAYILFLLFSTWLGSENRNVKGLLRLMLSTLSAGLLGLALAAIYLLPLIAEARYVEVGQWTAFNYSFSQHFVYFAQLLSPDWGYGYSGPGLQDGMPFQLGVVPLVLVIFGAWLLLSGRVESGMSKAAILRRKVTTFFLLATICIVWLLSPAAQFVWLSIPIASLVQFPWRLLGMSAITMAVVAGSTYPAAAGIVTAPAISSIAPRRTAKMPVELALLALVVVLGSFAYTLPQYTDVEDWRESPQAVIRWDRYSPPDRVAMVSHTQEQPITGPMEIQYLEGKPLQVAAIVDGEGEIVTLRHGGASDEVLVRAAEPVRVEFYTYDFPGWQLTLDGEPVPHGRSSPYGLITTDVPAGEHDLALQMGSTPSRTLGSLISLLALLCIGALCLGPYWSKSSTM